MGVPKEKSELIHIHSDRESILDNVSKIGSETLAGNWTPSKNVEKLPKILNVIDSVSKKASLNLWECTGIGFITCKRYKKVSTIFMFCKHILLLFCAATVKCGQLLLSIFRNFCCKIMMETMNFMYFLLNFSSRNNHFEKEFLLLWKILIIFFVMAS